MALEAGWQRAESAASHHGVVGVVDVVAAVGIIDRLLQLGR